MGAIQNRTLLIEIIIYLSVYSAAFFLLTNYF
jgi:hypothetical protein